MSKHQAHDKLFKATFTIKKEAERFIKHFLPKEIAEHLDTSTLELDDTAYLDEKLEKHYSDVVYNCKWKGKTPIKVSLLFEHKSWKAKYVWVQYMRYMSSIWIEQIDNNEKPMVIIPILVYHGKSTWKRKDISADFGEVDDVLKKFIPSFSYLIQDLTTYSDEELMYLRACFLLSVLLLFKHSREKDYLLKHVTEIFCYYEESFERNEATERFEISLLHYIIKVYDMNKLELNAFLEKLPGPLQEKTTTLYDRILLQGEQIGMEKGEQIGLEKGEQIGLEKGEQIGLEKGAMNKTVLVVEKLALKHPHFTDKDIAEIVERPIEFVQEIRRRLK